MKIATLLDPSPLSSPPEVGGEGSSITSLSEQAQEGKQTKTHDDQT
jgi:hypothetical protein